MSECIKEGYMNNTPFGHCQTNVWGKKAANIAEHEKMHYT
jgi:hypothetical protein